MTTFSEVIGKHVLFRNALNVRVQGTARMPAKDHNFIVVTPDNETQSVVVSLSDIISIIA